MISLNEEDLKAAIVAKATDEILQKSEDLSSMIAKEVRLRLDKIFVNSAEAQIQSAIDAAVSTAFEREYRRVTSFGEPQGEPTSIRKELETTVSAYWSAQVDARTGKPASGSYGAITRAEYLMTQVCAEDFTKGMAASVQSVTGALKDGLRVQLAKQMDRMLSELFQIKSLQDQGKVEKPW